MPDIVRVPLRMVCSGIDLVHPIDRMPEGSFPYLFNARIVEEGRIDGRPGYTQLMSLAEAPNSIRRLNDPSKSYNPGGYTYVGGGGANLYVGDVPGYAPVLAGFSGDPLSLVPFRPDQSPESWMYVYDANKMVKVRPDGVLRSIGIAPPTTAPNIEYGVPATADIDTGQATTGWSNTGGATGPALTDRTPGGVTASIISYVSGPTGWALIHPSSADTTWQGERMKVILNSGQPNAETVTVREVLQAVPIGTISAIQYDTGSSGLCTITVTGNTPGFSRNSMAALNSNVEVARVIEVNYSPDGSSYSLRLSTLTTIAAGQTIEGLLTWYCYTTLTHGSGETITTKYLLMTQATAGTGGATKASGVNASRANGRAVNQANDYIHLSLFLQNPQNVISAQLLLSLDGTPNFSFTDPGNSLIFTFAASQLVTDGAGASGFVEILVPISSATRTGGDFTRTLANITGYVLQVVTSGACNWGFDWVYVFGTYGPTVQPNSPTGLSYQFRYRDSTTGSHSVPSPLTRYELFPLREAVIITPQTTDQAGVDTDDIYRTGATVPSPLYVSSVENLVGNQQTYTDGLPDDTVLAANQPPDLAAIQPWPLLVQPWAGICRVVGTSVEWTSGDKFNTALLDGSVIIIEGTAYQCFGSPASDTQLQIRQNAEFINSANFAVSAPTLAGQPLPFAFGPEEGPFAPVVFALGDPLNGGTLYFSNFSDADGASDKNTLELSTPSQNLVSGAVWRNTVICGSREDIFLVRYSYLTTIGVSNSVSYEWTKLPAPSGIWSRWACCACPVGVAYLGRDGIYIATDSGASSITDEKLNSLFPHDGQPASPINSGSNIILPVDMTQLQYLKLSYCDETLRFSYRDTGGNFNTLIFEIYDKRWMLNNYADAISGHYLVEGSADQPNDQEILMLSIADKTIKLAGGDTDGGRDINTILLSASLDGGDQRSQKLYVDTMLQAGGTGLISAAAAFDNAQSFSPVAQFNCNGQIQQFLQNIAKLSDLSLHRNVGVKLAWTGGPSGPKVNAWEVAGFAQPYLSTFFVTQVSPFSFPGWKHIRRMFPALISNGDVIITLKAQDGRTFGPYTIANTQGQYRILPQMLSHGIKDLAFALQLDGQGVPFAFFPTDFTIEVKEWREETFINLAVFRA